MRKRKKEEEEGKEQRQGGGAGGGTTGGRRKKGRKERGGGGENRACGTKHTTFHYDSSSGDTTRSRPQNLSIRLHLTGQRKERDARNSRTEKGVLRLPSSNRIAS